MQIPVGLLVDRFGSRSVMLGGTVLLALAQAGFSLADSYGLALVARTVVGIGDALTFICVLRLVSRWFPDRRVPLMTQLTGTFGQLGAVGAADPDDVGAGPLRLDAGLPGRRRAERGARRGAGAGRARHPDGRHLRGPTDVAVDDPPQPGGVLVAPRHPARASGCTSRSQFSSTALTLLWGYPFLVRGEGLSARTAGLLLTLMIVAVMVAGPVLGWLVGRHPWHRSTTVLCVVATIVTAWAVVLAWPGDAPLPLLVVLVLVTGVGGPASMIGFDLARTSNPVERLASASGIINQAGFTASLVLVLSIGVILDWRTPGSATAYTPSAFRWAMSVQYVLWALGLLQIWRYRRRTRGVRRARRARGVPAQLSGRPRRRPDALCGRLRPTSRATTSAT